MFAVSPCMIRCQGLVVECGHTPHVCTLLLQVSNCPYSDKITYECVAAAAG
jgi:hypothetical protein